MSSNLKRRVRERMAITGERYTEARAAILADAAASAAYAAAAALAEREAQRADLNRLLSTPEGT